MMAFRAFELFSDGELIVRTELLKTLTLSSLENEASSSGSKERSPEILRGEGMGISGPGSEHEIDRIYSAKHDVLSAHSKLKA